MQFGDFDSFGETGRGKETECGLCEQGFAAAGRSEEKEVVVAGAGDSECAFGLVLADNIFK